MNLLNNTNKKTSLLEDSGVYTLTCEECGSLYIGETGRKLHIRIKEHIKDKKNSAFGKHLNENNHNNDKNNIELVRGCRKGNKMNILEALEIEKHKNKFKEKCLNEKTDLSFAPMFKLLKFLQ